MRPCRSSCRCARRSAPRLWRRRCGMPTRRSAASSGESAKVYFDLALRLLAPPAPVLVAIGGLSGTGKSALARALAPFLAPEPGAVVVRSDVERKILFGVDETERLSAGGLSRRRQCEGLCAGIRQGRPRSRGQLFRRGRCRVRPRRRARSDRGRGSQNERAVPGIVSGGRSRHSGWSGSAGGRAMRPTPTPRWRAAGRICARRRRLDTDRCIGQLEDTWKGVRCDRVRAGGNAPPAIANRTR